MLLGLVLLAPSLNLFFSFILVQRRSDHRLEFDVLWGSPNASCIVYREGPVTEFDFWVQMMKL